MFNALVSDHFLNANGHFIITCPPSVFKRPSDINQNFLKRKILHWVVIIYCTLSVFGRQTHILSRNFKTKLACLLNGLNGYIREKARRSESCFLIGYRSGRNGPISPARDFPRLFRKDNFSSSASWPYNQSFNVQSCSANIAGYWPRSFLRFFWSRLPLGP